VREQAPQTASRQRAADRKRDAGSGGPSWTRTRSQWIKNAATATAKPALSNDFAERIGSGEATKRPETTHFGHGVQNEKAVVPMDDVHRSAAALLHRVGDGAEIPIEVLRGFAELVLHSELVAGARAVLDGPPEFAMRRAVELASVVLASGVSVDLEEARKGTK
jgi:hypothetical protein